MGTGLFYTSKVPPAAAPHAGHQGAFLLLVILVVAFIAVAIIWTNSAWGNPIDRGKLAQVIAVKALAG